MTFKQYKEKILKDPRAKKLEFTPDDRLHYVYRVTELNGLKQHYYGTRTDNLKLLIGCGYYTSSTNTKFRHSFKTTPENYRVKIIKKFSNRADAIILESYLHRKFNVKQHTKFINNSNQTPFGFDVTGKLIGSNHSVARSIYKIDKNTGEIIEEFGSMVEAEESIGKTYMYNSLRDKTKLVGGFVLCYKEDYNKDFKEFVKNHNYNKTGKDSKYSKSIFALDPITGKILHKFDSTKQAKKFIKEKGDPATSARANAKGMRKISKGFLWLYEKDLNKNLIKNLLNYESKSHDSSKSPVIQLDKNTGEILNRYPSISAAFEDTGAPSISLCCMGLLRSSGGYLWKYDPQHIKEKQ